jgi:ribosomal protein S18 acetylase RimI-like enzyme
MLNIITASSERDYQQALELFDRYAESLHFNLCFQNYEEERRNLCREYGAPAGCLLLVKDGEEAIGCVALRKMEAGICEMKRMYVKPEYRGKGVGRKLAEAVIEAARELNYQRMRLDTISQMTEAIALYRKLGFYEIQPYRYNPIPGVIYMEKML